jgi:lipoprotein-anchoring transpeptidase ErfK/SrfK
VETIKTAVVVVLLLAVLYGVYVVLNKPDLAPPQEVAWNVDAVAPPEVETGVLDPLAGLRPVPLDKQAAQAGQPTPASSLAAAPSEPASGVPQGAVKTVTDSEPIEAASAGSLPAAPTLAVPDAAQTLSASEPSNAKLASASVTADPLRAPRDPADTGAAGAVPAGDGARPATEGAGQAAPAQESIYAQASNSAAQGPSDFRSIRAFDNAWNSAIAQLQKQQWAEALLTLSFFFHDPDLTGEERQRLLDLLDPLAGKVIYSNDHTLEAAYEVRPGERLETIAQQYQVPVTLLQQINGIANPDALRPGTRLKVLRGPFRAEIDLKRSELVLFAGKYYAGRFPVSVGNDPAPQPSEYQVLAKEAGREYIGANGIRIPARSADNPYGDVYLDLGNRVGIHGSPDTIPASGLGCLSLSAADVADVRNILSVGSKVTIR